MGNRILQITLFLTLAAFGQQQERIAIMGTVDNQDSIDFLDLSYLTDKLRYIAGNVLPKTRYGIMTQQSIVDRLGSMERMVKECKEATCLAELGRKISADYIAQGYVGRFSGKLTIKVELYNVGSGNLIGSIADNSENLEGLLAVLESQAPKLFGNMPGVGPNNAGTLEVKQAYLDGIGKNTPWVLTINDKIYPLGGSKLNPGDYAGRLRHECYEDIDFSASIKEGILYIFDMSGYLRLKKGGLFLNAERGGKPANEPVFVDGSLAGETPFSGSVPLCSKIEIEGDIVGVRLAHNEKVLYTHSLRVRDYGKITPEVETSDGGKVPFWTKKSFWVAVALDVAGAVAIITAIKLYQNANMRHDSYNSLGAGTSAWEFDNSWENVESSESLRNIFIGLGSVLLAGGIGVHIWF